MKMEKQALHTTLRSLRDHNVCADSYNKLAASIGADWPMDKPINLLTILDSNPVEDVIWALSATTENSDMIARLIAADCAESVLHIYEAAYPDDRRPRDAIAAARAFALGEIDDVAWVAARDAARAARAAGDAWDAAWAAAWAAAGDAEKLNQIEILKKYLATDEE